MEEFAFKMSLEGPRLDGRGGERVLGSCGEHRSPRLEFAGARGSGQSPAGAANALATASRSLQSLTLFPFLPGSSIPSLAALRDMTVSTSAPPQTSLSALKSSGTCKGATPYKRLGSPGVWR